MLLRRERAYSSSCSQLILVYLHPFHRNSLFAAKIAKKSLKNNILRLSTLITLIDLET